MSVPSKHLSRDASIIILNDDGGETNEGDKKRAAEPAHGLSELSKQLRSLQSTNHDYAKQVDQLERKLKILTDLKGVSIQDVKSALFDACQGEAYNELRSEVETLRAQLDLIKTGATEGGFDKRNATGKIANLELRVGELEEVEESLRAEISKLYENLREQSSKATRLASEKEHQEKRANELDIKYKALEQQRQRELESTASSLRTELETAESKIADAEAYALKEKERVEALLIQVAEFKGLEVQLLQEKRMVEELTNVMSKEKADSKAALEQEVRKMKQNLEAMEQRAVQAESRLDASNEKVRTLEQEAAKVFSLECKIAQQKVELQHLAESSTKTTETSQATHRAEQDAIRVGMDKLQRQAEAVEAKLQAERAKNTSLEKEVGRLHDMERQIARQADELAKQRVESEKDRTGHDQEIQELKEMSKKEIAALESRILKIQEQLDNEKKNVNSLGVQLASAKTLQQEYAQLKSDGQKLMKEKNQLSEQEKSLHEDLKEAKADKQRLQESLNEFETKLKLEESKAESLQKQMKSVEEESKLRKKQFKSRFKVQEDRIEDLEQQLSSLYTAFNMERGERTEEHKEHVALQMKLGEADSKVAHQLHDFEEHQQHGARAAPTSPDPAPVYQTPQKQTTQPKTSPLLEPTEVGIAQGFLLKRDKLKGWKKRYFFLHGNMTAGAFSLSYGDGPGKNAKSAIHGIRTSLSIVYTTKQFPKQPYAFVVEMNPNDNRSPTVQLAALNKSDLDMWMTALKMATQGIDTGCPQSPVSEMSYPMGSRVIIVDLVNHPEYNGLSGIISSPLKDQRQIVTIDTLDQKVKLSPANLELFSLPDDDLLSPPRNLSLEDESTANASQMRYGI